MGERMRELCFFVCPLERSTLPKWGVQPTLSLNKKLLDLLTFEFSHVL